MPQHELGFKQILCGIYMHTSAQIIAAPMAHYLALHESHFRYSHDTVFLPANGMYRILHDLPVQQHFWAVKGSALPFHTALYFLHRPEEMEAIPLYKFFMQMRFVKKSEVEKSGDEYFTFSNKHAYLKNKVVVYRERECVPVFPWKWLGSTRKFSTNLLKNVSKMDKDYVCKEEYALKFMILFLPFRTLNDLQLEGSYQKRFQEAVTEKEFHDNMLRVAENIQNLYNSMESTMPENSLLMETSPPNAEDIASEDIDMDMDNEDSSLRRDLQHILLSSGKEKLLEEEASVLNPQFTSEIFAKERKPQLYFLNMHVYLKM